VNVPDEILTPKRRKFPTATGTTARVARLVPLASAVEAWEMLTGYGAYVMVTIPEAFCVTWNVPAVLVTSAPKVWR
jgi:hypothetical protein